VCQQGAVALEPGVLRSASECEIDGLSEQVAPRLGPSAGRRLAASTLAPPFILTRGLSTRGISIIVTKVTALLPEKDYAAMGTIKLWW
jgi:hypothetical protein